MIENFPATVEQVFHDWNYGHPKVLYGLIRSMKPATVVEVGAYRGYGTAWMARALQENGIGQLYAIDNFSLKQFSPDRNAALTHFWQNLYTCGVEDLVTLLEGDSDKVIWPGKVDFAYIDGWHGYLAVKNDFERCAALGAECICLDDTTQSVGPRMFVEEMRSSAWDILRLERDCGLVICMRRSELRPITFSQELPDNPGVDLQMLTREEQAAHFDAAEKANGISYAGVRPFVHTGREP